jgi:hypothetical protein
LDERLLQCRLQQQHPELRPSAKKFCKGCGVLQEPQVPKSANRDQEHRLVGLRRIASRRSNRKARAMSANDGTESNRSEIANSRDAIAQAFLRLGRIDGTVFERLGRYEMNMWRQTLQTILLLNLISRHVNDDGLKSSPSYLRFKPQKTSQLLRWPPVKPFLYD